MKTLARAKIDSIPVIRRSAEIMVPAIKREQAFQYSTPKRYATKAPTAAPDPGIGVATSMRMNRAS